MKKKKISIDEGVRMCSGVCCMLRMKCWRYWLNTLYDKGKAHRHTAPIFVEPGFDGTSCHFFRPVNYKG